MFVKSFYKEKKPCLHCTSQGRENNTSKARYFLGGFGFISESFALFFILPASREAVGQINCLAFFFELLQITGHE